MVKLWFDPKSVLKSKALISSPGKALAAAGRAHNKKGSMSCLGWAFFLPCSLSDPGSQRPWREWSRLFICCSNLLSECPCLGPLEEKPSQELPLWPPGWFQTEPTQSFQGMSNPVHHMAFRTSHHYRTEIIHLHKGMWAKIAYNREKLERASVSNTRRPVIRHGRKSSKEACKKARSSD